MKLSNYILPAFFFLVYIQIYAQEDPVISKSDNTFVNKLRESQPRPKFFSFDYSFIREVGFSSKSETFGRTENEIEHNPRFTLKLRAPIIIKPDFNLIGGFKMRQEIFDFENGEAEPGEPFENLDRRTLQNIGLSLIMKKEYKNGNFLYAYWNGNLNSDDVSLEDFIDQLRTNLSVIYVKNKNELTQVGFGGAFGYIFGEARVFPVFVYNQTFSKNWNIDMMIPKSVKLRYTHSAEMHSYFITDINGASYFLRRPTIQEYEKLTFQRSAVNFKFRLEREIYDWLWFGLEAGYNLPINLFISEPRKRRKDAIVTINSSGSPIIGITLFAVVPKKIFYKRAKEG